MLNVCLGGARKFAFEQPVFGQFKLFDFRIRSVFWTRHGFLQVTAINFLTSTLFSGGIWVEFSKISYQYYSVVGVLTCVLVAHVTQLFLKVFNSKST